MPHHNNLLQWQALEFEPQETSRTFYIWSSVFLILTILYALITNSPIMAITFILIGIIGFITIERNPSTLSCAISSDGVIVNRELYPFEGIESFWIASEEDDMYISLKTSGKLAPFIHVPLGEADPNEIRTLLIQSISEEKHEPSIIDTFGKMLHIR